MEPEEYDRVGELEEQHWRYRAIRRTLLSILRRQARRGAPLRRILDAGCGTGGTLRALAGLAPAVGVDIHPRALALARERGVGSLVRAHVARLPFASASFDAVVSVDVLYHRWVEDDAEALAELARVCRPGGTVVLWLPAYAWMRSSHDEIVHTARRYTRTQVRQLAARAGLHVQNLSYVHAPVLLAAIVQRGLQRLRGAPPRSSLRPAPSTVNQMLHSFLVLEGAVAQRVPLPFGLSLLAVLRRAAEVRGVELPGFHG
jgi:SAM-dependent methyltransferase